MSFKWKTSSSWKNHRVGQRPGETFFFQIDRKLQPAAADACAGGEESKVCGAFVVCANISRAADSV